MDVIPDPPPDSNVEQDFEATSSKGIITVEEVINQTEFREHMQ